MLKRMWVEDSGVLTVEWVLLITLLVVGIVGVLAVVRDALNYELLGVSGAILSVDPSYVVPPPISVSIGAGPGTAASGGAVGFSYIRPQPRLLTTINECPQRLRDIEERPLFRQ